MRMNKLTLFYKKLVKNKKRYVLISKIIELSNAFITNPKDF